MPSSLQGTHIRTVTQHCTTLRYATLHNSNTPLHNMPAAAAALDPNGWATSPPSVLVKVQDTSRAELNGQIGVVLQYAAGTGGSSSTSVPRYTVQMAVSQDVVSLKPANLKKASLYEQITGQYQFLVHNPAMQQQLRSVHARVHAVLPAFIQPEYLAIPVVVMIGVLFYLLGFTRTMLLFSFLMVVGMIVGPDMLAPNTTVRTVVRNAPMRFRGFLREQVPVVGNRIADSKYMTAAFAGVFLFFFVNAMTVSGSSSSSKRTSGGGSGMFGSMFSSLSSSIMPPTTSTSLQHPPDFYYKLGFDDATHDKPFGTSLPAPVVAVDVPPPVLSDEWRIVDDDEMNTAGHQHTAAGKAGKAASPWYTKIGSAMSFYYIYNTVKTLGEDPATAHWSWQRCLVAARAMEPWRMGMLGLSIYKVVSLLFIK